VSDYYRRTPVVSVQFDPYNFGNVVVVDLSANRATMSVAAFEATCRLEPGAVVLDVAEVPE
jgi:hypothetical protein